MKTKILVVWANPDDSSDLRSDRIFKAIKKGIHRAEKTNSFEFLVEAAASVEDFFRALEHHKPDLLHLIGHGNELYPFVFESAIGQREETESAPLSKHISHYRSRLRGVIICACNSYILAKNITATIPFAFGIDDRLNRDVASAFSEELYFFLAQGNSIQESESKCQTALANNSDPKIKKAKIPELLVSQHAGPDFQPFFNRSDRNNEIRKHLAQGSFRRNGLFLQRPAYTHFNNTTLSDIIYSSKKNAPDTLLGTKDVLEVSWKEDQRSIILEGSPRSGKTKACFSIWNSFKLDFHKGSTVLYLPCGEVERFYKSGRAKTYDRSGANCLLDYIGEKYLLRPTAEPETIRRELLREFSTQGEGDKPKYLLVLDGYDELLESRKTISETLKSYWCTQEAVCVQVLLTGRKGVRGLDDFAASPVAYYVIEGSIDSQNPRTTEGDRNDQSKNPLQEQEAPTILVITQTKGRMANSLTKGIAKSIYRERYHESKLSHWRPYENQPKDDSLLEKTIDQLLDKFEREDTEHVFRRAYKNGQNLTEEEKLSFATNPAKYIVIVDPVSLSESNRRLIKLLDNFQVKGVILPVCRYFSTAMRRFAEKNVDKYFENLKISLRHGPAFYDLFAPDVPDERRFLSQLHRTFVRDTDRIPKEISNSSPREKALRDMNFRSL